MESISVDVKGESGEGQLHNALKKRSEILKEIMPLRNKRIEYLQHMIARTEEEYHLYQKTMEDHLEKEQKEMHMLHEKKIQATEEAETQYEKFITRWEEKIAREQTLKSALEQRNVILSNLITQQEKRIQNEKDNYEFIKKLVSKIGTSGSGGERLKRAFFRIKELRSDPKRIFGTPVSECLIKNRSRLFEIDEIIFSMGDLWEKEFEEIIKEFPGNKRDSFEAKAVALREDYRNALLEEQSLLTEVITQENKFQNLGVQMNDIIFALEEFILPRLFWIRDAQPLSVNTPANVRIEIIAVLQWIKKSFLCKLSLN